METEHFGSFLKQRREERGLSLADVSRRTKIKQTSLELLEEARLEDLPAPVFVRGFVSAYARTVGANVAEALERYAQLIADRAPPAPEEVVVEPTVAEEEVDGAIYGRRRFGVALVVLLLLVVATLTLSLLLSHASAPDGGLSRAPALTRSARAA